RQRSGEPWSGKSLSECGNEIEPGRVVLTESAVRRIAMLKQQETAEGAFLRIAVSGGGCSGFQYGFSFDRQRNDDDVVFERDGVAVVVDEVSLGLLSGAEVDFVEDLMGASFQVRNPNAASSCGCGNSFSIG
ncbi:MAG: iron-sulfur cluster insertion protein ErpA, partial [Stellaceae bacterium]